MSPLAWTAVGTVIPTFAYLLAKVVSRWRNHVWERVCWGWHGDVTPKHRARWWVNTCWAFWIAAFWTAHPRSAWRARRPRARIAAEPIRMKQREADRG